MIIKGDWAGCYATIGKARQAQLNLGPHCMNRETILHEVMHILGFFHEQSREDRDDYVEVLFDNINPAYKGNFDKYTSAYINHMGAPYDYCSIMHYPSDAFSKVSI